MQNTEIARTAYIESFQLTQEATADIVDYISDNVCPLCKTDNELFKTLGDTERTDVFKCCSCGVTINIETWEVK